MNITKFLWEARRRRLFRGVGLYVVGAWLLLQIGDVVVEPLGLPNWTMTALLYFIVLCFPIALFLDWRYDLTPEGIVRTQRVRGEIDKQELALAWPDYLIFGTVALLISAGGFGLFVQNESIIDASTSAQDQPPQTAQLAKPIARNSIAVLPFLDMSAAGDQEYFADGVADTVLHMLARVDGLRVAARTSSFSYKGLNRNVVEIANDLGVERILEGSVHRAGNRLRVIAKLIEAKSGIQLWSEKFDGQVDDVFDIQDEIATKVMGAMQVAMSEQDAVELEDRYRPIMAAYDQGVLGLFAKSKGTVQELKNAQQHFEEAIDLDPNYPLPYIYLAETLGLQEVYALGYQDTFSGIPTKVTRDQQEPLIRKAIELQPKSGEAYAALASIQVDETRAQQNFEKAIRLDPGYANAYLWFARFLSIRKGDYAAALRNINKALELDPLSDQVLFEQAKMLWASGQAEKAMSMMKSNVQRSPHYPPYYKRIARWHSQLGDMAEAARWIRALRKLDPESPSHWGEWGGECWVLERLADVEGARVCNNEFIAAHPDSVAAKRIRAMMVGFGEMAKVMQELHREEPGNDYRANQYASTLVLMGRYAEVLKVVETAHPALLKAQPEVNGETTWPATLAVEALQSLGRVDEANKLLDALQAAIDEIRLIAGPGFTNGIENVEVAALRGQTDKALDLFQKAIDQGWRFNWNFVPVMTSLKSIHQEPRFLAMMDQLEQDIAKQRARYEASKDLPLF